MSEKVKGELYALVQAVLWGLFPVITILLYKSMGPFYAGSVSTFLGGLFFAALLTIRRSWSEILKRSAWFDILAASLILGVLFYALLFLSLRYTTAGNVAIIGLMEIFFSFLILSVFLRHEPATREHVIGAVLMVVGAIIILLPQTLHLRIGDGIVFVAYAIPPIGNMFVQRARKRVSAETLMFLRSLISSMFLFALALIFEQTPTVDVLHETMWLLLFNGIVLLGVTKWLFVESVHRISIPKTISLGSISPLFTLVFAYFILHETIELRQVIAIIPILLGVYLLTRPDPNNSTPIVHPVV
jgi:drug/metabolite transporter (DMT)-like permease